MSVPIVLAIVGPTATGKTKLAQELVRTIMATAPDRYSGFDFISADSRQVYQGLEITTGADIPATSTRTTSTKYPYPFYTEQLTQTHTINWHGASIIPPTQSWSVAEFRSLAHAVITEAAQHNHFVCVIGGTGLYHQALTDNSLQDLTIKPNYQLRTKAAEMSIEELQAWLAKLDPEILASLNDSDRQNPRRLIRHIERSSAKQTHISPTHSYHAPEFRQITVGTQIASLEVLSEKILERVKTRIATGALQEVALLDQTSLDPQASTTLGLREIRGFLDSQYDLATLEQIWALHEKQYAKRQLTWWKKRPEIQWLEPNPSSQITGLVRQILEMTAPT